MTSSSHTPDHKQKVNGAKMVSGRLILILILIGIVQAFILMIISSWNITRTEHALSTIEELITDKDDAITYYDYDDADGKPISTGRKSLVRTMDSYR